MPSPAFSSLARSRVFQATPLTTVLAVIGIVVSATACAETLVVTDSRHPVVAPEGVRVILLDEPDRIQQTLSADLPHDPQAAAALVQRRLGGPAGKATLERLRLAHQGVTDAWSLKLPRAFRR
ncbi:TIGR03757 family integrating conjugative element protein [Azomonas macrocytogenes]|uniref:Integrating conjugative element protein (TIGR03757 family) n=1 Tax=Azomonas macrocytogenes TaxID=69962 RepID=A0A839TBB6_AZOMA|nr:TIGR03757 family integrating conjugative element protein [Azomonas macrocytogenes]MBB3105345.1 integrating conjugative element protein (TIGR03757 family) [Azomonas macrocytogenes]